jgi:hypothetical protein
MKNSSRDYYNGSRTGLKLSNNSDSSREIVNRQLLTNRRLSEFKVLYRYVTYISDRTKGVTHIQIQIDVLAVRVTECM